MHVQLCLSEDTCRPAACECMCTLQKESERHWVLTLLGNSSQCTNKNLELLGLLHTLPWAQPFAGSVCACRSITDCSLRPRKKRQLSVDEQCRAYHLVTDRSCMQQSDCHCPSDHNGTSPCDWLCCSCCGAAHYTLEQNIQLETVSVHCSQLSACAQCGIITSRACVQAWPTQHLIVCAGP